MENEKMIYLLFGCVYLVFMFLTTYIKCKLKYSYATSKFIGFIITWSSQTSL